MWEKFENGVFTLKKHQIIPPTLEEFKKGTTTSHFGIVFEEIKLAQGNHMIIKTSSFSKSSVFKMFSFHTNTQIPSELNKFSQ